MYSLMQPMPSNIQNNNIATSLKITKGAHIDDIIKIVMNLSARLFIVV